MLGRDQVPHVGVDVLEGLAVVVGVMRRHLLDTGGNAPHRLDIRLRGPPAHLPLSAALPFPPRPRALSCLPAGGSHHPPRPCPWVLSPNPAPGPGALSRDCPLARVSCPSLCLSHPALSHRCWRPCPSSFLFPVPRAVPCVPLFTARALPVPCACPPPLPLAPCRCPGPLLCSVSLLLLPVPLPVPCPLLLALAPRPCPCSLPLPRGSWPFSCVRPLALLPAPAPSPGACPPAPLANLPRLSSAPRPAPPWPPPPFSTTRRRSCGGLMPSGVRLGVRGRTGRGLRSG